MNYPQQWPPQPPQYPQHWTVPAAPPSGSRKSKVVLLILVPVAIMVLAVVGLVGFYVVEDVARGGIDGRGGSRDVTHLSSFDVVCDRGSISNAAQLGKPYKIAAFSPNNRPMPVTQHSQDRWTQLTLTPDADYVTAPQDFRSVNVVACLTPLPETAVNTRSCNVETKAGEQVTFDYYAVKYNIELREARTGKRIEQLPVVDGPAPRCPLLLWINTHDRKMYADPDIEAVNAELADFAHR